MSEEQRTLASPLGEDASPANGRGAGEASDEARARFDPYRRALALPIARTPVLTPREELQLITPWSAPAPADDTAAAEATARDHLLVFRRLRDVQAILTGSPDPVDQQLLAAIETYIAGDMG